MRFSPSQIQNFVYNLKKLLEKHEICTMTKFVSYKIIQNEFVILSYKIIQKKIKETCVILRCVGNLLKSKNLTRITTDDHTRK